MRNIAKLNYSRIEKATTYSFLSITRLFKRAFYRHFRLVCYPGMGDSKMPDELHLAFGPEILDLEY